MTKVLVVDDERDIRELLITELKDSGYETIEAENGAEALDRVYKDRPDIVLLDLMMPVLDGLQVLEVLKFNAHTANLPVVVLTANSADEDEQRRLDLGVNHHITKPWEPGAIQTIIEATLREAATGEQTTAVNGTGDQTTIGNGAGNQTTAGNGAGDKTTIGNGAGEQMTAGEEASQDVEPSVFFNHPRPQILIVDDQNGIRRTMTGIIEDLGYQVVDVEDGYQAISSVRDTTFDLVFLDIKMPGINGIQTFREIKKLKPDSLVVMMTGFDVPELIDASFDEGAICVIHKPFEPEQIVSILRSAHKSCLAKLPTDIGALVGEIQHEIDSVIAESPIARVTVRIPDDELRALRLLAVSGPASGHTQTLCSPASLGGIAFYSGEAQVINDYESHPLKSESDIGLGIKSALAVPIRSDSDRILGSVAVYCYEADYFSTEEVERFRVFGRDVGNLMETTSPTEAEFLHGLSGAGTSHAQTLVDVNR